MLPSTEKNYKPNMVSLNRKRQHSSAVCFEKFPNGEYGKKVFPLAKDIAIKGSECKHGTIEISNELRGLSGFGANFAEEENSAASAS